METTQPNSTMIQTYPKNQRPKLEREPRNNFEKKIKEWEDKNILYILTRNEREEEYQKALIELHNEMEEFIKTNYPYASESTKDRVMSKQKSALRFYTLTPEEWQQKLDESTKWLEDFCRKNHLTTNEN